MEKLFSFLAVVALLSGCATVEWVHPTKSKAVFYEEKLACEELANRLAWQRYPALSSATVQNTIYNNTASSAGTTEEPKTVVVTDPYEYKRSTYRDESFEDCLRSKGWVERVVER